MNSVFNFFDRLEDHVRGGLSKSPIVYSLFGGIGVILFWRGLWHTADYLQTDTMVGGLLFSGLGSLLLGLVILLTTGLFVSVFIGESIMMSGLKHEKKVTEKTELELIEEKVDLKKIERNIAHLEDDIHRIEKEMLAKKDKN